MEKFKEPCKFDDTQFTDKIELVIDSLFDRKCVSTFVPDMIFIDTSICEKRSSQTFLYFLVILLI